MTSIYQAELPSIFPYSILGSKERITQLVIRLLQNSDSFAITTEAGQEGLTLWMSETSWRNVSQHIAVPEDLD